MENNKCSKILRNIENVIQDSAVTLENDHVITTICSWKFITLKLKLMWIPNWHSTLLPQTPEVKGCSSLSFSVANSCAVTDFTPVNPIAPTPCLQGCSRLDGTCQHWPFLLPSSVHLPALLLFKINP